MCFTSPELRSASSYGHFTAAIEFWSQCHILRFLRIWRSKCKRSIFQTIHCPKCKRSILQMEIKRTFFINSIQTVWFIRVRHAARAPPTPYCWKRSPRCIQFRGQRAVICRLEVCVRWRLAFVSSWRFLAFSQTLRSSRFVSDDVRNLQILWQRIQKYIEK